MTTHTLSQLIKLHGSALNANAINSALIRAGVLEKVEYLSRTGTGEIKHTITFTAAGLKYGENVPRNTHKGVTTYTARFYSHTFGEVLEIAMGQFSAKPYTKPEQTKATVRTEGAVERVLRETKQAQQSKPKAKRESEYEKFAREQGISLRASKIALNTAGALCALLFLALVF